MAFTTIQSAKDGILPPIIVEKTTAYSGTVNCAMSSAYMVAAAADDFGAIAAPTPGLSGAALTSYANTISFGAPTGDLRIFEITSRFGTVTVPGQTIILCDRLWHNSGIVVGTTTAQTVDSVAWPARDINESTDGEGVMVGLEVSATMGNSLNNAITMSYTNSAGTSGRTGTFYTVDASAALNKFFIARLAAEDKGVRSIQSITLSTTLASGSIHLVAFRPICMIGSFNTSLKSTSNAFQLGFPPIFDNSCLFSLTFSTSSITTSYTITPTLG
jgi:hypothetical protein